MALVYKLFHDQLFIKLPRPEKSAKDQTVIVTGSNTGIGLECARHFIRLGAARVILAVRTIEKGEAAKKDLENTEKRQGVVEVWPLDLSSYESVKQFAAKVQGLQRLDVMLENAGVSTTKFSMAEDNESTITTNVVSTFLLALSVLPKLRETATNFNIVPHLTIVSSDVHFFTQFPEKSNPDIFQALSQKKGARMTDR